ncbi:5'/3'-nucleotidase SurE [Thermostilla marina]
MRILLTNDDGIYAPGLAAMAEALTRLGEVHVVAPATEKSGVGHSITYLIPLVVKEVFRGDDRWGWAVEGSPADCVKIGIAELCPERPDLIVSGINGGLNAGINVLYSGTVAAAIEGAFFGIDSVAVSLQFDEHAPFEKAAGLAAELIGRLFEKKEPRPRLYNLNIPLAALEGVPETAVVPMDVTQYGEKYEKRFDPWGRAYYWATGEPRPTLPDRPTDLTALAEGKITITPLHFDLTDRRELERLQDKTFELSPVKVENGRRFEDRLVLRTTRKQQQIAPELEDDS